MPNDNTPILIGTGLTVQKEKDANKAKSPMALLAEAAEHLKISLDQPGATNKKHSRGPSKTLNSLLQPCAAAQINIYGKALGKRALRSASFFLDGAR